MDQEDGIPCANIALVDDAQVGPKTAGVCEAFVEAWVIHACTELPAREPRLRDLQEGGANLPPLADYRIGDRDSDQRQILPELARLKRPAELLFPPDGILARIRVDGLVGSAMCLSIPLVIAGQIHAPNRHATLHRRLPYRAGGALPKPFDQAWTSDVDREDTSWVWHRLEHIRDPAVVRLGPGRVWIRRRGMSVCPGRSPYLMDFTIVGAGAIGGVTGAHLARAGHRIVLVDRDRDHVDAIRRHGLEVGGSVDFTAQVPAYLPQEVPAPIRTLILAVKTLHTSEALEPLVPLLAPDGYVLSMQNGLEEPKIAALVGWERTVGAFLTFGAYYERPGRVIYSGPASLRVGEPDGRITPRVQTLARVLSDFHPTEATDNIQGFLWGKLILGAIYFATATVDADVIEILARPRYRGILADLATEACQVADALNIRVEPVDGFDPHAVRTDAARNPIAAEAAWDAQIVYWQRGISRRTGVWRDLAIRRRKTEALPILGALIDAADRVGQPVTRVCALLRIIGELEEDRRQMDWENLQEIDQAGG